MGPFWRFFTFKDTELEKRFWDSSIQEHRLQWACMYLIIFSGTLALTVRQHLSLGLTVGAVLVMCAISFLMLILQALPSRWYRHARMHVDLNIISMLVLNAFLLWFTITDQSHTKDLSMTNTTPGGSDAEVVRTLLDHLEMLLTRHHIRQSVVIASCGLTVMSFCSNSCKTVLLVIASSCIMNIVWLAYFFPVSMNNKVIGMLLLPLFVIPVALSLCATSTRRKVFLGNFLLEQERAHSQDADSILNHTLKNIMSDAAGQLEICLDDQDKLAGLSADTIDSLRLALASLQRGMKCCQNRQTYISLVSGTYNSAQVMVTANRFLSYITMGRTIQIENQLDVDEIQLDPALMDLVLDNAIANATKHGHPEGPNVRITVKGGSNGSTVFQVTNLANPNSEVLSPAFVESMFSGEERHRYRSSSNLLSSGIGLQCTQCAALAAGTEISLWQEGNLVIFQAVQPSSCALPSVDRNDQEDEDADGVNVSAFPNGLHFCCIDDSLLSIRTLEVGLKQHAGAAKVDTFGQNGPGDVPRFMGHAPRADIIIFDNYIDFPGEQFLGVELLRTIKQGGFQGLLVIRSGNTSDEDILQYREAGCHCVVGKEIPIKQATTIIKKAYLHQQASRALPNEVQAFSSAPRDSDAHFSMI